MTVPNQRLARRVRVVGALALVVFFGSSTGESGAYASNDDSGIGISVPVVDSSAATEPQSTVALPFGSSATNAPVVITLSGLKPFSFIEIFVNSTPVLLASGHADAAGSFTVSVALPAGLEGGSHTISATGMKADGTAFNSTIARFSITAGGLLAQPEATSIPSATSKAPPARSNTSPTTVVSEVALTTPAAVADALGEDPFDLGGVFYLSGLVASAAPVIGPEGGNVTLAFTVKNATSGPLSADLRYWLENAAGMGVAQSDDISVIELEAGQTKTLSVTLPDVGQWGILNAQMTFTPPDTVRGTVLTPVTRDTLIILPPYFVMLVVGSLGALFFAARYVLAWQRARRQNAPAFSASKVPVEVTA
ncbi:hypothetical protein [Cryobacterium ruanii]|uniref:Ig-like domain repeat protein n=1 Tax=Cryobacterium ruanii TaxID=1259197 RepID=A0A4V3ITT3_9MICO|nr:hypothetical protein [Cryobacterium ruanii]TFD68752.1 hypothetical protein E3T47_01885 [Cryobacterium ruanii]